MNQLKIEDKLEALFQKNAKNSVGHNQTSCMFQFYSLIWRSNKKYKIVVQKQRWEPCALKMQEAAKDSIIAENQTSNQNNQNEILPQPISSISKYINRVTNITTKSRKETSNIH